MITLCCPVQGLLGQESIVQYVFSFYKFDLIWLDYKWKECLNFFGQHFGQNFVYVAEGGNRPPILEFGMVP